MTKVHREAIRFARDGYTIILIGHAGHDEVIGTMGEAPEAFRLVQTVEDAAAIEIENIDRLAYLTQTTLSVTETADIIAKLKERFPRHRVAQEGRHLLCHAESSGGRADAERPGRRALGRGQPSTARTVAGWPSWASAERALAT